ncbi:MAG: FHA domain-containing protein [Anaerolineae bacterium]|nr:FHA domain-containing protein [Anaerolineae bacterium]
MRASEFVADVLYLYVAGAQNQKPIQHQGKETIILGRSSNSTAPNPATLIDLSPYRALSLGVSRQHARINYSDDGYTIEDLNSSNGTWLNGNRLSASQIYRIRPGDHVQLGELLMFIYYV